MPFYAAYSIVECAVFLLFTMIGCSTDKVVDEEHMESKASVEDHLLQ